MTKVKAATEGYVKSRNPDDQHIQKYLYFELFATCKSFVKEPQELQTLFEHYTYLHIDEKRKVHNALTI